MELKAIGQQRRTLVSAIIAHWVSTSPQTDASLLAGGAAPRLNFQKSCELQQISNLIV